MQNYTIYHKKLSQWYDPEKVFTALFATEKYSFWLDSSKIEEELSRFSYIGDINGSLSKRISYTFSDKMITVFEKEREKRLNISIFDYLENELNKWKRRGKKSFTFATNLPFDFVGGFVGYFGYELQAECGSRVFHTSSFPDAYFFFVDRFLAIDHKEKEIYLVCISEDKKEAESWFEEIKLRITNYELQVKVPKINYNGVTFQLARNHKQYLEDIQTCQEYLAKGESYQICLTNQITAPIKTTPKNWFVLYKTLRKINPAPYSAYMRFGDFAILSSSPEMFLKIDKDRTITSKPIKGTVKRGETPQEDTLLARSLGKTDKDFAENVMIVDVVRNDLGKVGNIGSVQVSKFLDVETYATMHQLVSTITGRLRDDMSALDAIKAAFPGGSMTGAPKFRAMEIIAGIEKRARGIYSGSLGFLSLNGAVNLSIIIRTIIATEYELLFGAGGAILIQSDKESEYQEMLLKATSLIEAITLCTEFF